MAGFIITPPTSPTSTTGLQVKTGSDQTALCLCISCVVVCVLQNTQRISSSQSAQPLGTPVVSVTTPSLAPQGLVYSSMPTSYNPAGKSWSPNTASSAGTCLRCAALVPDLFSVILILELKSEISLCAAAFVFTDFSLNSAEISSLQGFGSPGLSLGSMSAWQQHQLGQAALNSLV